MLQWILYGMLYLDTEFKASAAKVLTLGEIAPHMMGQQLVTAPHCHVDPCHAHGQSFASQRYQKAPTCSMGRSVTLDSTPLT